MSLTLSPSTDKLVKVGSKEFEELLRSPTWGSHFTSPLTPIPVGKVRAVHGYLPSSIGQLPPMPIVSTIPVLTPVPGMTRTPAIRTARTMGLPPLNLSSQNTLGMTGGLQSLASPLLRMSQLPPVPRSPLLYSNVSTTRPLSPIQLPNIPSANIPTISRKITMIGLRPVPTSPTSIIPTYYQKTLSMNGLSPVPTSPLSSPVLPRYSASLHPVTSRMATLPMTSLPPLPMSPRLGSILPVSSPVSPSLTMIGLSPVPSSPALSRSSWGSLSPISRPVLSPVSSPSPYLTMIGLSPVPSSPTLSRGSWGSLSPILSPVSSRSVSPSLTMIGLSPVPSYPTLSRGSWGSILPGSPVLSPMSTLPPVPSSPISSSRLTMTMVGLPPVPNSPVVY